MVSPLSVFYIPVLFLFVKTLNMFFTLAGIVWHPRLLARIFLSFSDPPNQHFLLKFCVVDVVRYAVDFSMVAMVLLLTAGRLSTPCLMSICLNFYGHLSPAIHGARGTISMPATPVSLVDSANAEPKEPFFVRSRWISASGKSKMAASLSLSGLDGLEAGLKSRLCESFSTSTSTVSSGLMWLVAALAV